MSTGLWRKIADFLQKENYKKRNTFSFFKNRNQFMSKVLVGYILKVQEARELRAFVLT